MSTIDLEIVTAKSGFYNGFNKVVTIGSKLIIAMVVVWAAVFPDEASTFLTEIKNWSFAKFGAWYVYVTAFYLIICLLLAINPRTGSVKLGKADDTPEFSRFSWISMMLTTTFLPSVSLTPFAPATVRPMTSPAASDSTRSTLPGVNRSICPWRWW